MLERALAEGLLAPGTTVVAMLSGGRDSVCMLDLAVRVVGPEQVTALHMNYGLRDDSDSDELHCVALCESLGVALEIERPRRPEGPGNLQAWARDARYAAAAAIAERRGATIVTGHTADDQVETILYRLASSPSRRALLGMRPQDGRLARPLLGFTRAETTAYCEQRGLAWRDDGSNAEPAYARNRVRHGLLPELAKIHPAAAANVLRTAALLRDEAEVLDALVDAELDGSASAAQGRADGTGRGTISMERFARAPPGPAPPRPPAPRRRRRRPPGPRSRPLRRPGRRPAPCRHRDARPGQRSPRCCRARRPTRRTLTRPIPVGVERLVLFRRSAPGRQPEGDVEKVKWNPYWDGP